MKTENQLGIQLIEKEFRNSFYNSEELGSSLAYKLFALPQTVIIQNYKEYLSKLSNIKIPTFKELEYLKKSLSTSEIEELAKEYKGTFQIDLSRCFEPYSVITASEHEQVLINKKGRFTYGSSADQPKEIEEKFKSDIEKVINAQIKLKDSGNESTDSVNSNDSDLYVNTINGLIGLINSETLLDICQYAAINFFESTFNFSFSPKDTVRIRKKSSDPLILAISIVSFVDKIKPATESNQPQYQEITTDDEPGLAIVAELELRVTNENITCSLVKSEIYATKFLTDQFKNIIFQKLLELKLQNNEKEKNIPALMSEFSSLFSFFFPNKLISIELHYDKENQENSLFLRDLNKATSSSIISLIDLITSLEIKNLSIQNVSLIAAGKLEQSLKRLLSKQKTFRSIILDKSDIGLLSFINAEKLTIKNSPERIPTFVKKITQELEIENCLPTENNLIICNYALKKLSVKEYQGGNLHINAFKIDSLEILDCEKLQSLKLTSSNEGNPENFEIKNLLIQNSGKEKLTIKTHQLSSLEIKGSNSLEVLSLPTDLALQKLVIEDCPKIHPPSRASLMIGFVVNTLQINSEYLKKMDNINFNFLLLEIKARSHNITKIKCVGLDALPDRLLTILVITSKVSELDLSKTSICQGKEKEMAVINPENLKAVFKIASDIKWLSIAERNIKKENMKKIIEILKNEKKLERLDLSYNTFDENDVTALIKIQSIKKLMLATFEKIELPALAKIQNALRQRAIDNNSNQDITFLDLGPQNAFEKNQRNIASSIKNSPSGNISMNRYQFDNEKNYIKEKEGSLTSKNNETLEKNATSKYDFS